jgi:hypothetical protein
MQQRRWVVRWQRPLRSTALPRCSEGSSTPTPGYTLAPTRMLASFQLPEPRTNAWLGVRSGTLHGCSRRWPRHLGHLLELVPPRRQGVALLPQQSASSSRASTPSGSDCAVAAERYLAPRLQPPTLSGHRKDVGAPTCPRKALSLGAGKSTHTKPGVKVRTGDGVCVRVVSST